MKRSKRLQPLAHVTQARERAAAQALGASRRELQSVEARLQELRRYLGEYQRHLDERTQAPREAGQLSDFRRFLERLHEAILYQESRWALAQRDYEHKHRQWLATRQRAAAIEKVVARCRNEEQRLEDRREQRESDERAQRHRSRSSS
jgi:flagellar FliJ protein